MNIYFILVILSAFAIIGIVFYLVLSNWMKSKPVSKDEIKENFRITTNGKQYRVEKFLFIFNFDGDFFPYSPYYTELSEAQEALAEALEYEEWKPIR